MKLIALIVAATAALTIAGCTAEQREEAADVRDTMVQKPKIEAYQRATNKVTSIVRERDADQQEMEDELGL